MVRSKDGAKALHNCVLYFGIYMTQGRTPALRSCGHGELSGHWCLCALGAVRKKGGWISQMRWLVGNGS